MGSIVWVVLTAFALALAKPDSGKRLLCFVPALAILFTLYISAPITSDFRYIFLLFLLVPFLPVFLDGSKKADGVSSLGEQSGNEEDGRSGEWKCKKGTGGTELATP